MSHASNHPWLESDKTRMAISLDQDRLGHAPMICGPVGLGKTALADWLARRLLCLSPAGQDPCGECPSCRMIDAGTHPDQFRVGIPEEKREIPVDSIRELTDSLQLTPSIGARRLGLVEPAEAMNRNAANALLKTLEEPHPGAWLILVSHQPGRLPATVRSRCQIFTVRPPAPSVGRAWLRGHCPDASDDELVEALDLSAGAPLAARALLEEGQLDFGHAVLDGLIGIADGEAIHRILDDRWVDSGPQTWRWLALWCSVFMRHSQDLEGQLRYGERKLPSNLDPACLARLWEQALSGTALSRGNARQDLLLGRWLLEWQRIC
jgi:DNA polymerase-3 subunit delta'